MVRTIENDVMIRLEYQLENHLTFGMISLKSKDQCYKRQQLLNRMENN